MFVYSGNMIVHTSSTQILRILKRIIDSNDLESLQKDFENLALCPKQLVVPTSYNLPYGD